MSNAAFINALMEEGTKQDCLDQVVKLWNENCELRAADRDHLAAKNGMEKRLNDEIERLQKQLAQEQEHYRNQAAECLKEKHRADDLQKQLVCFQWQPIATAPRDGTNILLTDARIKDWTQVAFWDEDRSNGYVWARDDASTFWHKDSFTHWMPLPAAPDCKQTDENGK